MSALYNSVVESIDTAILALRSDPERNGLLRVVAANPAAGQLFGAEPSALAGAAIPDLLAAVEPAVHQRVRAAVDDRTRVTIEHVEGLGTEPSRRHSVQLFPLADGATGMAIDDVTGPAMVEAALRRAALHDGLTGLPNRTLMRDRLRQATADAKRRGERVSLILLDMNDFKAVNDRLGHHYGDRLLSAFAQRLQELLRECDTIARLGGDEFALLLRDATVEGATRVTQKVMSTLETPFVLGGPTVRVSASIGVAMYPDDAEDTDLLEQRADLAMYTAKGSGSGWCFYSPAHDQASAERMSLLDDLHRELDELDPGSLQLRFQPILDLQSGRVVGAEALLRWDQSSTGFLNPRTVIEVAELGGLIGSLTRAVARDAIYAASRWNQAGCSLPVSVNLSVRGLQDRGLVDHVLGLLAGAGLPPSALRFDLPEPELMDDPILIQDVVGRLAEAGVRTAIDDFGTGHSSLAYLHDLPIDELKIDTSFVASMVTDERNHQIVRTVIDLAHDLGARALGEGVSDPDVLELLRDYGCDRAQGMLISPPVTARELLDLVQESMPRTG